MTIFEFFTAIVAVIIALIDLRHKYIYNFHIAVLTVLVLLGVKDGYIGHFIGGLIGFLFGYVVYKLAFMYYREEAFGFGDVLLLGVLGLYFGTEYFPAYLMYFYFVAGLLSLVVMFLVRKPDSLQIPMAPVYIAGAFIYIWAGKPAIYVVYRFLGGY